MQKQEETHLLGIRKGDEKACEDEDEGWMMC